MKENKKTFYVTTPIYYPSGNLHIGHVYTTTLAWTLRNFKQLNGFDAKMLTGADEHGQKIQQKAEEAGIAPQIYVDQMTEIFKKLWVQLEIDWDYYSRTTAKNHEKAVAGMFTKLVEQGEIYKGEYKGLYSVSDEEFLTPTQAVEKDGEYYHPLSGHKLEEVSEESYFYKMSDHQESLLNLFEDKNFVKPAKIVKELKSNFLNKGLEDLSVTRTSFDWGVKINEDDRHVVYVWLDALTNYITALGYDTNDDSDFKKYWSDDSEIVHIVGKEITRFHCIYWPIILESLGLRQPTTILSHGWIVTPEGKMSKSKGNVIDPIELIEEFGPETIKYFFASQINMGTDGIFDKAILKDVYNTDLANTYGNLLSRTIAMIKQNFDGPVKYTTSKNEFDINIENEIRNSIDSYQSYFNTYDINKGLKVAIELSRKLNGYIDNTQPWTLKDDLPRLEKVLNTLLNGLYAVTTMLSVVMPNKTKEALSQLNIDNNISLEAILDFEKFDSITVKKGLPLFERIK